MVVKKVDRLFFQKLTIDNFCLETDARSGEESILARYIPAHIRLLYYRTKDIKSQSEWSEIDYRAIVLEGKGKRLEEKWELLQRNYYFFLICKLCSKKVKLKVNSIRGYYWKSASKSNEKMQRYKKVCLPPFPFLWK